MHRSRLSLYTSIYPSTGVEGRSVYTVAGILGVCFLGFFQAGAQPFQKLYTNPTGTFFNAKDICTDVAQGFYVTGAIQGNRPQAFVFKTDPSGQMLWSKTFSAADPNFYFPAGISIQPTSDNGLIISTLKEQNTIVSGGALFKTTNAGVILWAKYAPCLWRNGEVCSDDGNVYYASQGKGTRKVYLGKISNTGQVIWEQWLEAADMDFYDVESLVRCGNGDLLLALKVSKLEGNSAVGPEQTILFRINPAGVVQKIAFFPVVHLTALMPLSDGRIAFRCSASDITWTGIGLMDCNFNWLWFKKARLDLNAFLPNIIGQEMSVSGDETRMFGIFYTSGGEKMALTFDLDGNLLQQEVYFSGPYEELAAPAVTKSYVRASGIRTDAFTITRSETDGIAFEDCFFPLSCGLKLGDTLLLPQSATWQSTPTTCLQSDGAISNAMPVNIQDYCVDPGPMDAGFDMSDSIICTGDKIAFKRRAGISIPVFGLSEWTFEGGIPNSASGPRIENVRFNQVGMHTVRHIFTIAGCRDTSFTTISVISPPVVELGADTTLCPGDTMQLYSGAQHAASYLWSTNDSSAFFQVTTPGIYAVTVTQSGGCSASDAIDIRFLSPATVSLGPDTILCPDAMIRLFSPETAAGYNLTWSNGSNGPSLDIFTPGLYALQLNAGHCVFSDTIAVYTADCSECKVYAPNVFSPESAPPNHIFQLFPGCPVLSGRWRIYDRWGGLVFEGDLDIGWDGRLNGKMLQAGVYLFDADLQLAPMQQAVEWRKVSGSVALVR